MLSSPYRLEPSKCRKHHRRHSYTPRLYETGYFVIKHLQPFIQTSIDRYIIAESVVADVGCGEQPFRQLIETKGGKYIGIDIAQNSQNTVDVISSAASVALPDNSVDFILCTEVIEHIADLNTTFSEFHRILKPNGHVCLTCPFLFQLHEEPYDFNRPTPYLIQSLSKDYDFKIVQLNKSGNELEAIAVVLDAIFSLHIFKNRMLLLVWHILRISLRSMVNFFILILSKIFNQLLRQEFYLSNLVILQK
jgi:SAM-dependent methyltransferase